MIIGPLEAGWPADRLGELLRGLAERAGLSSEKIENPPASLDDAEAAQIDIWLRASASWLDCEAEETQVGYSELDRFLAGGGPAILRIKVEDSYRFLGLLGSRGRRVRILQPEGGVVDVPRGSVRDWVCARVEDPLDVELRSFLRRVGVPEEREGRALRELLRQRLAGIHLGAIWMIRPVAGSAFIGQLRRAGVVPRLISLCLAHALQYSLFVGSWWVIGKGVLEGRTDAGWLMAWVLMLLSLVPLRMWTVWLQGSLSVRGGAVLKRRLLAGALRLEPEEIRHQGTGQLLGRVLESEALETLSLSGGFLLLLGGIEAIIALWVLGQGAGGWVHVVLLILWLGVSGLVAWRHFERSRDWTSVRLDLTDRLIESMLGYRTRLAQEGRSGWHKGEDRDLEAYVGTSISMDRLSAVLATVVPRGWLVLGILALAPGVAAGSTSIGTVAIAIGGVLLSYRALLSIAQGVSNLFGAVVAWERVKDIFDAAGRPELKCAPSVAVSSPAEDSLLLEARDVTFSYPSRSSDALRGCDFSLKAGDRVLLEGPSGSGKSTFAALLAGLRRPTSGLLLLGGLDQQSTGLRSWRRSVVLSPQFHENHIFTESLAFNLLMGRRWPAYAEELEEAEKLCRELGLGALIDRMPGGIHQMVGDTGWQLSHGERNRVFLARVLLQQSSIVMLDETLDALDAGNAARATRHVLESARSLLAIAHT